MVMKHDTSAPADSSASHTPRNVQRGIETRDAIKTAAARLFSLQGYEAVTMRQIAQEAACSHTAIYMYFKDKESLLQAIAVDPLEKLRDKLSAGVEDPGNGESKLFGLSQKMLRFCLDNRKLYRIFFASAAARVDMPQSEGTLNHLRNELFALLRKLLASVLKIAADGDPALEAARIYFYMLQGIIATYDQSDESTEALLERLSATFDRAFRVCISGLKELHS